MTQSTTIWVASDHAGFELKERVLSTLRDEEYAARLLAQDQMSYIVRDGGPSDDRSSLFGTPRGGVEAVLNQLPGDREPDGRSR